MFSVGDEVREIATGKKGRVYLTNRDRIYVEFPTVLVSAPLEYLGGMMTEYGTPKNLKKAYSRNQVHKHLCRWYKHPQRPRPIKEANPPKQYVMVF